MLQTKLMINRVRDMFPLVNGLFVNMDYSFPPLLNISKSDLDLQFLANWGMRSVAPIVTLVHQSPDTQLSSSELETISRLILQSYKYKWDKLSLLLSIEYDPIHNYSDEYSEQLSELIDRSDTTTHNVTNSETSTDSRDLRVTDGGTETHAKSTTDSSLSSDGGSETRATTTSSTDTRTDNLSEDLSGSVENEKFGFNSYDAVGDNTSASHNIRTNTGTQGNTSSGTESLTVTGGLTKSVTGQSSEQLTITGGLTHTTDDDRAVEATKRTTGTEGNELTSERTRNREFSHLGNIGNHTTQQLLQEEIELWRWNFVQEVLNDVKDFLTLPLYD